MTYVVFTSRIPALEKENKKQEVYDCVRCQGLLFICIIIGLASSCTFTGVFVSNSGIFETCTLTDSSYNSTNGINTSETKNCLEDCRAFAIVHITSLVFFGLLFMTSLIMHGSAQEKVALPVHSQRQSTDDERLKFIANTRGITFLFYLAIAAFTVIGFLEVACLHNYKGIDFWDRIYIGAFIMAGTCLHQMQVNGGITITEKEGRIQEISQKIKYHGMILFGSFFGIGFAWAMIGIFITKHDVFQPCNTDNSTKLNVTSDDDFCFHDCKGSVIANIVFMALFVLVTLFVCVTFYKKAQKLLTNDKNVEPVEYSANENKTLNNQNETECEIQNKTVQSRFLSLVGIKTNTSTPESSEKTDTTKKSDSSAESSDELPMNYTPFVNTNKSKNIREVVPNKKQHSSEIPQSLEENAEEETSIKTREETLSKTSTSDKTFDSSNDIPMNHPSLGYTNTSADFREDDLYRNQHISETPPPLVYVVDRDSTMPSRRLPPITRYKSLAATPSVEPPRYDDVVTEGDK